MIIGLFLFRRLAGAAAALAVISFLVFGLLALSPGSVVATLLGPNPSTPDQVAAITREYRLNDAFPAQYWHWAVRAVHGDLGRSVQSGQAVTTVIADHLPVTLELALFALVLVALVGIPLGMAAALRHGRALDRGVSAASVVATSAPPFAVSILLIYVFGVRLGWLPVFGAGDDAFTERVAHLTLPAVALAIGLQAAIARQTRAALLGVLTQDYLTFAMARGLSRPRVLFGYALRNAALPVVTAAGLLLIVTVSATVLVETVFAIPGTGQLLVQAIQAKDIPVVQGLALVIALIVLLAGLVVDVAALVIDPRVRYGTRG